MPSIVDVNAPADDLPVHKGDLRAIFRTIKTELEHGGFFGPARPAMVERTMRDKVAGLVVDVQDFGAVGNDLVRSVFDVPSRPVWAHPAWEPGWNHADPVHRQAFIDRLNGIGTAQELPDELKFGLTGNRLNIVTFGTANPLAIDYRDEATWLAFELAIRHVAAAGGGTVRVPNGRYRTGRQITLRSHVALVGESRQGVHIWNACGNPASGVYSDVSLVPGASRRASLFIYGNTHPSNTSLGIRLRYDSASLQGGPFVEGDVVTDDAGFSGTVVGVKTINPTTTQLTCYKVAGTVPRSGTITAGTKAAILIAGFDDRALTPHHRAIRTAAPKGASLVVCSTEPGDGTLDLTDLTAGDFVKVTTAAGACYVQPNGNYIFWPAHGYISKVLEVDPASGEVSLDLPLLEDMGPMPGLDYQTTDAAAVGYIWKMGTGSDGVSSLDGAPIHCVENVEIRNFQGYAERFSQLGGSYRLRIADFDFVGNSGWHGNGTTLGTIEDGTITTNERGIEIKGGSREVLFRRVYALRSGRKTLGDGTENFPLISTGEYDHSITFEDCRGLLRSDSADPNCEVLRLEGFNIKVLRGTYEATRATSIHNSSSQYGPDHEHVLEDVTFCSLSSKDVARFTRQARSLPRTVPFPMGAQTSPSVHFIRPRFLGPVTASPAVWLEAPGPGSSISGIVAGPEVTLAGAGADSVALLAADQASRLLDATDPANQTAKMTGRLASVRGTPLEAIGPGPYHEWRDPLGNIALRPGIRISRTLIWQQSRAVPDVWYVVTVKGGDPGIGQLPGALIVGDRRVLTHVAVGDIPTMQRGCWGFGDLDGLGFRTIYCRPVTAGNVNDMELRYIPTASVEEPSGIAWLPLATPGQFIGAVNNGLGKPTIPGWTQVSHVWLGLPDAAQRALARCRPETLRQGGFASDYVARVTFTQPLVSGFQQDELVTHSSGIQARVAVTDGATRFLLYRIAGGVTGNAPRDGTWTGAASGAVATQASAPVVYGTVLLHLEGGIDPDDLAPGSLRGAWAVADDPARLDPLA
jgi:hypothetical protein